MTRKRITIKETINIKNFWRSQENDSFEFKIK